MSPTDWDDVFARAHSWTSIRMSFFCYTCDTHHDHAHHSEAGLPEGWRETYRGYGGVVYICPDCIADGRKHQRDYAPRTQATEEPTP